MVNNSTNINNKINYLSPIINNHNICRLKSRSWLGAGRKNVAELNQLTDWNSNSNTKKQSNLFADVFAYICFHSMKPHTVTKMNDNINMDRTIAGTMNASS